MLLFQLGNSSSRAQGHAQGLAQGCNHYCAAWPTVDVLLFDRGQRMRAAIARAMTLQRKSEQNRRRVMGMQNRSMAAQRQIRYLWFDLTFLMVKTGGFLPIIVVCKFTHCIISEKGHEIYETNRILPYLSRAGRLRILFLHTFKSCLMLVVAAIFLHIHCFACLGRYTTTFMQYVEGFTACG